MIKAPKSLFGQILAYAIGGGGMTALHSGVYWGLAELFAVEPYVANTIAAVITGIAGYILHSRFTFGHGRASATDAAAPGRYVIVSLLCYALNSFWVWGIVKQSGYSVAMSIIPMVLITPWLGFMLNRFWTFKR